MNIDAEIAIGIEDGLRELGGKLSGCTPSMIAPSVSKRIIAETLSSAQPGNRCTVPGFESWRANDFNGWVQDGTGFMVDHLSLAESIYASGAA